MELELKNHNMLEYNLFKRSKITFPQEDCMELTIPDSVLARQKSPVLEEYLHKVFCERCQMDLKLNVSFEEMGESRYRKNSRIQVEQEVENVLKHAGIQKAENASSDAEENGSEKASSQKKSASHTGEKSEKPREKKTFERRGGRGDSYGGYHKDSNPDVVYGRDFEGDALTLESITGEMGEVIIRGQVLDVEAREIRNEKTILIYPITDFTDTITVKMFLRNEQVPEIKEAIKKGAFLKLKGVTCIDRFDSELTIGSVTGIKKIPDFTTSRVDTSPQKRVELHCIQR
jgi:DNA polymerase-3 subunit alpha (Gram-positive type)